MIEVPVAEKNSPDRSQVRLKSLGIVSNSETLPGIEKIGALIPFEKTGKPVFTDDPCGFSGSIFAQDRQSKIHRRSFRHLMAKTASEMGESHAAFKIFHESTIVNFSFATHRNPVSILELLGYSNHTHLESGTIMKRIFLLAGFSLLILVPPLRGNAGPTRRGASPSPAYDHALGRKVYLKACAKCHDEGIAGAPKIGDRKAWAFRRVQGETTLVRHAIEGYMCNRGVLPPRGGDQSLTDAEIAAATAYILDKSR